LPLDIFLMNLVNKIGKGGIIMEGRKILTSHGQLARLARERIVVGRFTTLADAVRDHKARTSALPVGRGPHDEALYERLRDAGTARVSRPGH
jgi:hypothetical protein